MTKEEAIEILQNDIRWAKENRYPYISEVKVTALKMAVEALEQSKTGHWLHWSRSSECSVCGYDTGKYECESKYCPNCGARMESEVKA